MSKHQAPPRANRGHNNRLGVTEGPQVTGDLGPPTVVIPASRSMWSEAAGESPLRYPIGTRRAMVGLVFFGFDVAFQTHHEFHDNRATDCAANATHYSITTDRSSLVARNGSLLSVAGDNGFPQRDQTLGSPRSARWFDRAGNLSLDWADRLRGQIACPLVEKVFVIRYQPSISRMACRAYDHVHGRFGPRLVECTSSA